MAFHFDLGEERLPEVEGRDDAARARWVPVAELSQFESQLFEDHAVILDHFLAVFPAQA
jgi:bifunctional NMN adenylyltransferase/nudix hydrolase